MPPPRPGHARPSTSPSCRTGFLYLLPPQRVGIGCHHRHSLEIQPTASSPTDGAVGLCFAGPGKDDRVRLLALAFAAVVLTGCSGESSSPAALGPSSGPTAV